MTIAPTTHQTTLLQLEPLFDAEYYRNAHSDLADLTDDAAWDHYQLHGRTEGRIASKAQARGGFLEMVPGTGSVLEIGPAHKPVFIGERVRYFDVQDSEGLRQRARDIPEDPTNVPDLIHFVSPTADLSSVPEKFDVVFSSHAIEHQTDLIQHLNEVEQLLKPGGAYFVICPDKRYCFDHHIPESTIGDLVEAHEQRLKTHKLADVVDAVVLSSHNDAARHWAGDSPPVEIQPALVTRALEIHHQADGGYVDVHAWRFSAPAFRDCLEAASALGLTALHPARVYDTPFGSAEFCAVFVRT